MGAVFTTIGQQVLTERLDAEFYKPVFLENERKLKLNGSFCCFENLLDGLQLGYTGPTEQYYEETGVNYLSSKNLIEGFIQITDATDRISVSAHKSILAKSAVKAGDVLISRTGTVGKGAVVSADLGEANIAAHLIALRLENHTDSYFFGSFLNSSHGMLQSERHQRGTIIQGLSVYDIPNFIIPLVSSAVQKYIGDKVRQAERLRAWALTSEQYAKYAFQREFQWDGAVLSVRPFNRLSVDELENRLDLKYNSPQRLAAIRHAKRVNANLQQLDELVDISAMIGWKGLTTENYTTSGPWLLRGVEFSFGVIRTEDLVCVEEHKYLEQPQIHLEEGDIALTKDGTIGKAIVIPHLPNRLAAGSTVARLRRKSTSDVDPYYLEFALAHEFVQCQIASFATGVAQPHITQEWIALLKIPRVKCESGIASAWQQHHISLNFAKQLTNAAKLLVEALIEGQLTEAELIAAEQALQAGSNQLDCRILSRLKTDGIDGQGLALFGDLDELYQLLAQAEGDR